jgi:hypothetical protein
MSGGLSADEFLNKIETGSSVWRDIMPPEEQGWLVGHVPKAVMIYLGFVSPRDLRDALEGFEKATRSLSAPIGQLVSRLSVDAQKILAHLESLARAAK